MRLHSPTGNSEPRGKGKDKQGQQLGGRGDQKLLVMGVGRSWKRETEIWESVRKSLRERER